jgi:hypothetical protein
MGVSVTATYEEYAEIIMFAAGVYIVRLVQCL